MSILENYLTEKALARQINKTPRTLQNWRQRRIGPPWTNLGKTVLYDPDEFLAWLKAQQRPVPNRRTDHRGRCAS
jgi:hypothetical protein